MSANKIKYDVLSHPQAYTAQDVAAATQVPGQELAKSVVLKADDRFVLAVLPAPRKVDTEQLQKQLAAREVRMAHESELASGGKLMAVEAQAWSQECRSCCSRRVAAVSSTRAGTGSDSSFLF